MCGYETSSCHQTMQDTGQGLYEEYIVLSISIPFKNMDHSDDGVQGYILRC